MSAKKLLPAGKLKNLNDCVVGAAVKIADGSVGMIYSVTDICHFNFDHKEMKGDIHSARLWIDLPLGGSMMHEHRVDGRSKHDAEHDIVSVCRPEHSKVLGYKVWGDLSDRKAIEKANKISMLIKLRSDTGCKTPRKTNVIDGFKFTHSLGKSGIVSVKIEKA